MLCPILSLQTPTLAGESGNAWFDIMFLRKAVYDDHGYNYVTSMMMSFKMVSL